MVRFTTLALLLAPLGALAGPCTRQLQQPPPCVRQDPPPSVEETAIRAEEFAQAFIVDKDITRAFEFIVEDYINHNPAAGNGSKSAWDILSPIWGSQDITVLRTKFESPQSWLNYKNSFGTVVDRFRWEGGCIAEHWDQGEVFPED